MTDRLWLRFWPLCFLWNFGCTGTPDISIQTSEGRLHLQAKETLRWAIQAEPPSLDFQKTNDLVSSQILDNLMEPLINFDFSGPEIGLRPGLLVAWQASADLLHWTLTLRPGVMWSDGEPFVAKHIVDGWKRLLEPELAAQGSYFLYPIKNARQYNEGKISDFNLVGARSSSALTVEVELERPLVYFPMLLTHHSSLPVRMDLIKRFGDRWTDPQNFAVLGPYILLAWQHEKQLLLGRNKKYFGTPARINNLHLLVINDQATKLNLFDSEHLDFIDSLPSTELRALSRRSEFKTVPTFYNQFYEFNTSKIPMTNRWVRQAIVHAIDRRQVTDLLGGSRIPTGSILPDGLFAYDPTIGLTFDPELARSLLKKAGYNSLNPFPRIVLKTNVSDDNKKLVENLQAQLKKNLNIDVDIELEDWKVFLESRRKNPAQLSRGGWVADFPDPDNFMSLMTSFSENNHSRWKNKKYDDLVAQASICVDQAKRRNLYRQAQILLSENEAVILPLYSQSIFAMLAKRLKNFHFNSLQKYSFAEAYLADFP